MPLIFILLYVFSSGVIASSSININGTSYNVSNNGSVSVVNGVVIDGQLISENSSSGTKKVVTKARKLSNFKQLQIDISADVEVRHSSSVHIIITAEENIIPLIVSTVENDRLIISSNANYNTSKGIKIKVYTNRLDNIEVNGSANVVMRDINQERLDLRIKGVGDLYITGSVNRLSALIDGSGDMNLKDLKSLSAKAWISGTGDISIYAVDELTARISGSGDIIYRGRPIKLNKSISGSGDIDQL